MIRKNFLYTVHFVSVIGITSCVFRRLKEILNQSILQVQQKKSFILEVRQKLETE